MNTAIEQNDPKWVTVCDSRDLKPDSGVCALVGGNQVAIFKLRSDESVYAVDNFDPFGKANVISRGVVGDLNGEVVVASPLYKQHFSLKTGQCLEDDSVSLATYRVRVDGTTVQVACP